MHRYFLFLILVHTTRAQTCANGTYLVTLPVPFALYTFEESNRLADSMGNMGVLSVVQGTDTYNISGPWEGSQSLILTGNMVINMPYFTISFRDFSICLWMAPTVLNTNQHVFTFGYRHPTPTNTLNNQYINLYFYDAVWVYVQINENYRITLISSTKLQLNTWYHYCIVGSADAYVSLYENGVNVQSKYLSSDNWNLSPNFRTVGNMNPTSPYAYYANAYIDDFRIYKSALSSDSVAVLYSFRNIACLPCTANFFCVNGISQACPINATSVAASSRCNCSVGKIWNYPTCENCARGTYASGPGLSECNQCATGESFFLCDHAAL